MNIPGDGTTWGLNSIQFIREKTLGSEAFYNLFIDVNGGFSEYTLGVCFYSRYNMAYCNQYMVFLLLYAWKIWCM